MRRLRPNKGHVASGYHHMRHSTFTQAWSCPRTPLSALNWKLTYIRLHLRLVASCDAWQQVVAAGPPGLGSLLQALQNDNEVHKYQVPSEARNYSGCAGPPRSTPRAGQGREEHIGTTSAVGRNIAVRFKSPVVVVGARDTGHGCVVVALWQGGLWCAGPMPISLPLEPLGLTRISYNPA